MHQRRSANRRRGTIGLLSVIVACSHGGCSHARAPIEQFGAMREVMRDGRSEPRVRLVDVASDAGVYAVGALAGLEGEITVAGGRSWVARVRGETVETSGPETIGGDYATLLTVGRVSRWESAEIGVAAEGAVLEKLVEQTARARGIDTTKPFPFLIEGDRIALDMHVVNGYCPHGTDPATMNAKPWMWSGEHPGHALVVGFFAPNAAGTMTHHGTSIHAHAIMTLDGRIVTGHVDAIRVRPGNVLKTPSGF